jgi:WD40 repeat protein
VRRPRVPPGTVGRFSADGRTLVYGDAQGRVWFYDTRSWTPRGEPLAGPPVPVESADLSPDGRLLAVTWTDGTARLWDVAARRPIGGTAINTGGNWITAAFAGDGRRLLFATALGGTVWDVRPAAWERHACAVAGRVLTRAEWRATLPGRDYAPACGPAVTP